MVLCVGCGVGFCVVITDGGSVVGGGGSVGGCRVVLVGVWCYVYSVIT